jgi:hypothetical protein
MTDNTPKTAATKVVHLLLALYAHLMT